MLRWAEAHQDPAGSNQKIRLIRPSGKGPHPHWPIEVQTSNLFGQPPYCAPGLLRTSKLDVVHWTSSSVPPTSSCLFLSWTTKPGSLVCTNYNVISILSFLSWTRPLFPLSQTQTLKPHALTSYAPVNHYRFLLTFNHLQSWAGLHKFAKLNFVIKYLKWKFGEIWTPLFLFCI